MELSTVFNAAVISGVISVFSAFLSFYALRKQRKSTQQSKLAEFRQAWINSIRDAMSEFQSYAITPSLEHVKQREFYQYGTKIELLLNPDDPQYSNLQRCMYRFLQAQSVDEKWSVNAEYVSICQKIIKAEWQVTKKILQN